MKKLLTPIVCLLFVACEKTEVPEPIKEYTFTIDSVLTQNGEKVTFESNLYWWVRQGDTTATITQAYVNYFTGQYTIVQLPPMIANKDELVPTTNCCSYSGKNGEINTVIAPIREMIGDTLVLKAYHYPSNKTMFTKIVLE